jgi:hypothetical protein
MRLGDAAVDSWREAEVVGVDDEQAQGARL